MTDQRGAKQPGGASAVYGLGFFGALVWYIQQASSFWEGVLGVLKSFVWPALLVYDAFKAFHH